MAPLVAAACLGAAVAAEEPVVWESEVIADRAGALLTSLLKPLEDGGGASPDPEAAVGADAIVGVLRPAEMPAVHREPAVTVFRAVEAALKRPAGKKGPAALRDRLNALAAPLAGGHDRHVKVKIVSTDVSGLPEVRTALLFSFTGVTKGGRVEHQAAWEARWRLSGERHDPRLVLTGLTCQRCEEAVSPAPEPWLTDVTEGLLGGVGWFREQFGHGNPWWRARLQKSFDVFVYGHRGLTIGDANGDGLDDVYLCEEGGLPNRLLLQQPDGTVRDVSAASGTDIMEVTRAALLIDLDNDGDQDLVLGISHGLLMLENTGDAKFRQRTLLPRISDAYGLAAADYNDDGFVDIYVCGYQPRDADPARLPFPAPFYDARNGGENFLVRNEGGWKFANATAETGLDRGNDRFSFGAMWTDFDNDGLADLAVVNDFGRNNLYRQSRSGGKVTFTDVTDEVGLHDGAFGMAITAGDPNRDGWVDLYTANMFSSAGSRITTQPGFKPGAEEDVMAQFRGLARGNSLFLNSGGRFRDAAGEAGVAMGRWSWGSHFADLNNDGWEDLLVGNGNITGHLSKPDL